MAVETGRLSGKICVVTGATSGIGLATARALARLGAQIVGVGRDPARTEAARLSTAEEAAAAGAPEPRFEQADLSSLREVSALAARLAAALDRIDILVQCAAAFTARRVPTREGLETQFAVNHLAAFLLTTSLLPRLQAAPEARVITVSSASHRAGRIHWRDPLLKRCYFGLRAYEQSKLANVLFTYELARRLGPGSTVSTYAADPGLVNTELGLKQGLSPSSLFWRLRRKGGTGPDAPAAALAFLASSEAAAGRSGLYWKDGRPLPSSRRSRDEAAAKRLWSLSERIVAQTLSP